MWLSQNRGISTWKGGISMWNEGVFTWNGVFPCAMGRFPCGMGISVTTGIITEATTNSVHWWRIWWNGGIWGHFHVEWGTHVGWGGLCPRFSCGFSCWFKSEDELERDHICYQLGGKRGSQKIYIIKRFEVEKKEKGPDAIKLMRPPHPRPRCVCKSFRGAETVNWIFPPMHKQCHLMDFFFGCWWILIFFLSSPRWTSFDKRYSSRSSPLGWKKHWRVQGFFSAVTLFDVCNILVPNICF